MGFFSWKTADTNKSICNIYSGREVFTVYMKSPDGRIWKEDAYEGYGDFGGKDIYELIAELNGGGDRIVGIRIVFKDNPSGDFEKAAKKGLLIPTLVERESSTIESHRYPKNCPNQGYFY